LFVNSWLTKNDREAAGFWDAAAWEEVKKKSKQEIQKWIDNQMTGSSVTVVLIGYETASREYVGYEIVTSHQNKKGLLGIYIHNIKDVNQKTDIKGQNPFDKWQITVNGKVKLLSEIYKTYDWVNNNGYENLGKWVEEAAKQAGR
jgi:hypothetical protein